MEDEVRHIRDAVKAETRSVSRLGSRIAARFARIGLRRALPQLRGQRVRPPDFRR